MTTRRLAPLFVLLASACAVGGPSSLDEASEETGIVGPFDAVPPEGAADGALPAGPAVAAGAATEVWAVRNQWEDTGTAEARQAGVAWAASSGLSWEEKYDRWIGSLEIVTRQDTGRTFRVRTPFGDRAFDAPTLECAETAMFLRATFASWYGLPFFLTGWDSTGRQTMYAGHFGFVNASGARLANFPSFRTAYRDYTAGWHAGQAWPHDAVLRTRRLGTDDEVVFLSSATETAGAGVYFDEMFLNKRVGHFMRLLLLYFGSANLADSANTFQLQPEALAPGDLLIERWQRQGIGHVMPIFRRTDSAGTFEVSIASGSMPRRQPLWADTAEARHYFTSDYTGGQGNNSDGDAYARLGGGLRRWRTPALASGRWRNLVRTADRSLVIVDTDLATIAGRPARFGGLLANASPEDRRASAIARIAAARAHLAEHPASCSARTQREDAFADLYAVMTDYFGQDRGAVDREQRTLDDYVFAELDYAHARTCCWDTTTAAMQSVVMAYAHHEQDEATRLGTCAAPTIFRAEQADRDMGGDGYGRWRAYAASIGRSADWRAWSEDESCAARDGHGDASATRAGAAGFCAIGGVTECDAGGDDGSVSHARALSRGATVSGRICAGDVDVWRVSGSASVIVHFAHSAGDLDIQALDASGNVLSSSAGTSDTERVTATGTFYVRVVGYAGATNSYTIAIEG